MRKPDLKVVPVFEYRNAVTALRYIADEIEAGKYGEVGSVGLVLIGNTVEVFGMGMESDGAAIATLLTGHVHNRRQLELPGVMWETFRTLAPADAWANAAGYRAGRDMTSITFHAEHGEIGRSTFNVSMLEAA